MSEAKTAFQIESEAASEAIEPIRALLIADQIDQAKQAFEAIKETVFGSYTGFNCLSDFTETNDPRPIWSHFMTNEEFVGGLFSRIKTGVDFLEFVHEEYEDQADTGNLEGIVEAFKRVQPKPRDWDTFYEFMNPAAYDDNGELIAQMLEATIGPFKEWYDLHDRLCGHSHEQLRGESMPIIGWSYVTSASVLLRDICLRKMKEALAQTPNPFKS